MKNRLLKVFSTFSILIMVFCFSGCQALDKARENQAFGDSVSVIVYKGNEYKLLDKCDTLSPEYKEDASVFVTGSDVPVLLSTMFGNRYMISKDEVFLCEYYYLGTGVYCRADKFDEMQKRITNTDELTEYAVFYTTYNEETKDYENKWLPFSDELSDAFDYLIYNGEAEILTDKSYAYLFDVMITSEDRLFMRNAFSLASDDGKYFMVGESAEGLLKIGIPAEYNEEIEDMLKIYSEETDINLEFGNGFNPQYSY